MPSKKRKRDCLAEVAGDDCAITASKRARRHRIEEMIAPLLGWRVKWLYRLAPQAVAAALRFPAEGSEISYGELISVLLDELVPAASRFDVCAREMVATLLLCLLKNTAYGRDADLVQDTVVRALRGLPAYAQRRRSAPGFARYVFRIAKRRQVDIYRLGVHDPIRQGLATGAPGEDVATDVLSDTTSLPPAYALRVRDAVQALAFRPRIVFCMRHVEGRTLKETAATLGVSVSTVKRQERKALDRLSKTCPSPLAWLVAVSRLERGSSTPRLARANPVKITPPARCRAAPRRQRKSKLGT